MAGYKTPRRTSPMGLLADEEDPQAAYQGYQNIPVDEGARMALGPIVPLGEMASGQRPFNPDQAVQSGVEYALKRFTGGLKNPLGAAVHADVARAQYLDPQAAPESASLDPQMLEELRRRMGAGQGLLAPGGYDPRRPNDI